MNDVQPDGTIHGYIAPDLGPLMAAGSRVGATSAFITIERHVQ